jgi:hypothetical protein
MTMNESDDLSPSERDALAALPRARRPQPQLEDRVVGALTERGLLRRGRRGPGPAATLAAAAAALVLGALLGRGWRPAEPIAEPGPRYVLLLLGGAPAATPADHSARVAEYAAWARSVREAGRFITGEELGDGGRLLRLVEDGVAASDEFAAWDAANGYFIIEAADLEDATRLARACPHLRYGGAIVIRPIRPS